jgi:GNAT superfamily N-acetyltransferase
VQEFSRVLAAGHDVPQEHREVAEAATRAWLTAPGMTLHLALLDGRPAAAGALAISPPVGYLANAATLPEMRGRGAQTALIQARIAAAVQARCDAIVALGEFGSTSQRNLERAGLRVVYTQAVWRMRA